MNAEHPGVGEEAPRPHLIALDGKRTSLPDRWKERPASITFLRYFGCPFCQAFVGRLVQKAEAFDEADASVVLIGQGTAGQAMGFTGPRRVPFEMLVDPDRSAYRAFGLDEGGPAQLLAPAAVVSWVGVQVRGEGRQGGLHGGSLAQMPGTFVVDTGGVVRFAHRNRHQADDPDLGAVLAACRLAS